MMKLHPNTNNIGKAVLPMTILFCYKKYALPSFRSLVSHYQKTGNKISCVHRDVTFSCLTLVFSFDC